jgi:hypothetical protein
VVNMRDDREIADIGDRMGGHCGAGIAGGEWQGKGGGVKRGQIAD